MPRLTNVPAAAAVAFGAVVEITGPAGARTVHSCGQGLIPRAYEPRELFVPEVPQETVI